MNDDFKLKPDEHGLIVTQLNDGNFVVYWEAPESSVHHGKPMFIPLLPEELLALAVELDVWRWRITGDSYDPRVQARIRMEQK